MATRSTSIIESATTQPAAQAAPAELLITRFDTTHFSVTEFTSVTSKKPYPVERVDEADADKRCWGETRLKPLLETLETIRELAGDKPIALTPNGGYRPESQQQQIVNKNPDNEAVASATTSQHPKGRAADIRHHFLTAVQLHTIILKGFRDGKLPHLGGLGLYERGGFVHVDVRKRPHDDHLARWTGARKEG